MLRIDKHTTIWCLGISAIAGGYLFFVAKPQMARIRSAKAAIELGNAQNIANEADRELRSQLQKEVNTLIMLTEAYEEKIPGSQQLGTFLEELARLAKAQRLLLGKVEPGAPIHAPEGTALPIAFEVQGSFIAVFEFIKDIEHMPRMTHVESFTCEGDFKDPGMVTVDITVKIFYRESKSDA